MGALGGGESQVKTAFGYSPVLGVYPNGRFCSLRVKKLGVSLHSTRTPVLECSETHPRDSHPHDLDPIHKAHQELQSGHEPRLDPLMATIVNQYRKSPRYDSEVEQ